MRRPTNSVARHAALALAWVCFGLTAAASAQQASDVSAAYQNADFEKTVELAEAIEQTGSLTRNAYVQLLETKLLAQAALQDASGVDQTLAAMVELDRAHEFGPGIPPDLQARFASLRRQAVGEPAISLVLRAQDGDLVVSADLVADSAGLLRYFEMAIGDAGSFERVERWPARIPAPSAETLRVRVRALGPAKVPIAEAERTHRPTSAVERSLVAKEPAQRGDNDSSLVWWIVGGIAVVAVAGVTTTAILLSQEADTRVSAPMFTSP